MKHGSLFSGIGGFDLAAEWVGWENVLQVENDKFCNKVLKKNFPKVKRYGDIKEFKGHKGQCDIISGGFPCQPFSHAGKRQGETDDRYLWPEMLRVISEIKPSWVVGENVAGLISLENGKTLERIFVDLEAEGYEVESFIIPACSVGAWHRRDRIWIIAYISNYSNCPNGRQAEKTESISREYRKTRCTRQPIRTDSSFYSNDGSKRNEGIWKKEIQELKGIQRSEDGGVYANIEGRPDLSTPVLCRSFHGISNGMDRLKGLGNSIVPQVAYELFKAIEYDNQN